MYLLLLFQIYNEMIRDLLNPSAGILDLREDAKGGVQVAGLSEVNTRSTDEVTLPLIISVISI
jgi:kinesin family protein 18/19